MFIDLKRKDGIAHNMLFSSVDSKTIDEIINTEGFNPQKIDMKLFVNGIEVDLEKFSTILDESIDKEWKKVESLKSSTRESLLYDLKLQKEEELERMLESFIQEIEKLKESSSKIIDKIYE